MIKELKPTSFILRTQQIDSFISFAANFTKQNYFLFDYFHSCLTNEGISIDSPELSSIAKLLNINSLNVDELNNLITNNSGNEQAELITYRSETDQNILIKIDTHSYSEDQICPVDLLIKCAPKDKQEVDQLLVSWWTRYWRKNGAICLHHQYGQV